MCTHNSSEQINYCEPSIGSGDKDLVTWVFTTYFLPREDYRSTKGKGKAGVPSNGN